jgi:hypothetical protein
MLSETIIGKTLLKLMVGDIAEQGYGRGGDRGHGKAGGLYEHIVMKKPLRDASENEIAHSGLTQVTL